VNATKVSLREDFCNAWQQASYLICLRENFPGVWVWTGGDRRNRFCTVTLRYSTWKKMCVALERRGALFSDDADVLKTEEQKGFGWRMNLAV